MRFNFLNNIILNIFRNSPFSSEIIGPPKGFISVKKWLESSFKGINSVNYKEIHPSFKIKRNLPKTIHKEIQPIFLNNCEFLSKPTFVINIPNGRVHGKRADIITPDDKLLSDFSLEFYERAHDNPILYRFALRRVKKYAGKLAVISSCNSTNYYHWMLDILPRIELLRLGNYIPDKYVIDSSRNFQKESLKILKISENEIIANSNKLHIKADRLLVPSLPSNAANTSGWVCDFLRKTFLEEERAKNGKNYERIYISRAQAAFRRLLNEEEIDPLLEKHGFKKIILENLNLTDQISLFSSAKIIVAPHGAGLTNIVFSNPNTKLLELFPQTYINHCFWTLSNQVGLDYHYMIGEVNHLNNNSTGNPIYDDFVADIKMLEKSLLNLTK